MGKLALNKSSLNKEKQQLNTFKRYLPALELKRQQLTIEQRKAQAKLANIEAQYKNILDLFNQNLPMLAYKKIDIEHLVNISYFKLGTENIVGVKIPKIEALKIEQMSYSFLEKPHWVDYFVEHFKKMLQLKAELLIYKKRSMYINVAARITAQRVNLFSKILIPKTQQNITRIKIFLSDQERAGVVNAKISKEKIESVSQSDEY